MQYEQLHGDDLHPEYAKSQTANNGTSLYSICERLLDALNHEDGLSIFNSVPNVSEDIQRIQAVQMLSFNSKMVYAKNFGLSLFYFFGIDAFVRVISGSKNKKLTGELSSEDENEEYQSWDKLFYIDAFAFLIGISMIGLFAFINLTMIAYIFIAIYLIKL